MKYFSIAELTRSTKATQLGIKNIPDATALANLTNLVDCTLDPLRSIWGKPLKVNSGYRCPALNRAVGGATNSSHMKGMAADITTGTKAENRKLWELLIESPIPYTKIINEQDFSWLHISLDINNVSRIKLRGVKVNGVWQYFKVS